MKTIVEKKPFEKDYSDDQKKLLFLLKEKNVFLMTAPSFVIDFDYASFVPLMKGLGFSKVFEITLGAKIVTEKYQQFIRKNKNSQKFISATCPLCTTLIKSKYPEKKYFLMPFDSPMTAMAKIIKKNYPRSKIVFLSPCSAKKIEAKESKLINLVINFDELKELVDDEKVFTKKAFPKNISHKFDKLYNDYTKVYPLSGGLGKTIMRKGILSEEEIAKADGLQEITKIFSDPKNEKIFFDILFCKGGCVGGHNIKSKAPLFVKKALVKNYIKKAKREKIGSRKGLNKYVEGISFEKKP